jgi:hypothetical protein
VARRGCPATFGAAQLDVGSYCCVAATLR